MTAEKGIFYKKGLAFGVFDNFHKGHEYFLKEARNKCQKLTVVVARPEMVELLKNRPPKDSLEKRMNEIRSFNPDLVIIESDSKPGEWKVLKEEKPNIVFLGYDQKEIGDELEKMNIRHTYLDPHNPEKYKSSLSSF